MRKLLLMGRFHLISTAANVQKCHRCRKKVLAGWSEGVLVHVEPAPLTAAGSEAAREAGRCVYALASRELVYRDETNHTTPGLLLPSHTCDEAVPAAWRSAVPILTAPLTVADLCD